MAKLSKQVVAMADCQTAATVNVADVEGWRGIKVPFPYYVSVHGLFKQTNSDDSGGIQIAGPIVKSLITRAPKGDDNYGFLVEFINCDKKLLQLTFSAAQLSEPKNIVRALRERGLTISPKQEGELLQYLSVCNPVGRGYSSDRTGWVDGYPGDQLVYVTQTEVFPAALEPRVLYQPDANNPGLRGAGSQGTLADYTDRVVRRCSKYVLAKFALCLSLSATIMHHSRTETGGVHWYGDSSKGKTTILQIAASAFGKGSDPSRDSDSSISSWNATTNGLEGQCAARNHSPHVLDDLGACSVRDFSPVVYNMTQGSGKTAMNADRSLKKTRAFNNLILSSGEFPIKQKIEEGGGTAKAGQMVRFIDMPTDEGIFPGAAKEDIDALKEACGSFYGTLGRAFISALIDEYKTHLKLTEVVRELLEQSLSRLIEPSMTAVQARALKRFALAEVAGILAVRLGVLALGEEAVVEAVSAVVAMWLPQSSDLTDAARGVLSVRDFLLKNRDSRLQRLPVGKEGMRDVAGYWDEKNDRFYLTPGGFKEACGGNDLRAVASEMRDKGLLHVDRDGRLTSRVTVGTARPSVYAVSAAILDYASVGESAQMSMGSVCQPASVF